MTEPLRVLLVEDSPVDAKLVLGELRHTGRTIFHERVETASALRAALEKPWDVIISDWSLPGFGAPEALAIVGTAGLDVPFIIVSGTIGEELAVAAMRAGAHDYVLKNNLGRLSPAVLRETREHASRQARSVAENARGEAELRFRRIFDAGIIGIVIADLAGTLLEANDTFLQIVGYSREDMDARKLTWVALRPPVSVPALDDRLMERDYLRKDGVLVPVRVGVAQLDDDRTITVVTDLTERNLAERMKESLEEQLRQAQKMEAVGRLAGGIAHDFNNLLSVVISYAEIMLGEQPADSPVREDLEEIQRAGLRGKGLTSQLLMFSRQQVIAPRVLDLNLLIKGLDKLLGRLVGEDITLTCRAVAARSHVRVDPGSIEQLIMNLSINARDAMPTGGHLSIETSVVELGEEYVRTHLGARPGPHVMLAVTDTGCGIDEATCTHIFEPFFTTKEIGKGTGLGLSTAFGIVQQCEGHMRVESKVGEGTTFTIYLPLVDELPTVASQERTFVTLHGDETILLVEDSDEVRHVARNILRRFGYRVLEAATPAEAIRLARSHLGTIDLLVSDVVMPEMSGLQVAAKLNITRPLMKVLYMSGYTDDAAVRHGVIANEVAYLQKPITVKLLTQTVRRVLDAPRFVARSAS